MTVTNSNLINEETIARTQKRVKSMGRRELLDWAEVALPGMMRHLDAYRRSDEEAHLMELAYAEMQFAIVLGALTTDHAARRDEGLTTE